MSVEKYYLEVHLESYKCLWVLLSKRAVYHTSAQMSTPRRYQKPTQTFIKHHQHL